MYGELHHVCDDSNRNLTSRLAKQCCARLWEMTAYSHSHSVLSLAQRTRTRTAYSHSVLAPFVRMTGSRSLIVRKAKELTTLPLSGGGKVKGKPPLPPPPPLPIFPQLMKLSTLYAVFLRHRSLKTSLSTTLF